MTQAPLRVAILGTGMSLSVFHAPVILSRPNLFTLHSVVERSGKETCRSIVGDGVKIVKTFEEVLEDPAVDLVVVSTPNKTHFEYCSRSLQGGKHVLCEKPLVPTVKEAEELFALAEKTGKILCVYQNRRWDGDFLTVQKIIEGGQLGSMVEFTTAMDRYKPLAVVNKESWKERAGEYNDSIYNLGSHVIDQAIVLFGAPVKVTCRSWGMRGVQGLDDSFTMILEYPPPAGSLAPLYVTAQARILSPINPQIRFVAKGTNGSFTKYGTEDTNIDPNLSGHLQVAKEPGSEELLPPQKIPTIKGDFAPLYENLHEAIVSGDRTKLIVKPEQSLLLYKIMEAGLRSSREGITVAL